MVEEYAAQTAYALRAAARRDWPYPHAVVSDILPRELFLRLRGARVDRSDLEEHPAGHKATEAERNRFFWSYRTEDLKENRIENPELDLVYRTLDHAMVTHSLLGLFADQIRGRFKSPKFSLKSSFSYVEDASGYELLPHTDTASKLVTLLIYFADDDDNPGLGTELYLPRDPKAAQSVTQGPARYARNAFLRAATVPYRANTALAFAPSPASFHGVSPVAEGSKTRRLVQYQLLDSTNYVV
jgi:hypothetical protein